MINVYTQVYTIFQTEFPMMISVSAASLVHVHGNGLQSRLLSEAMQDGGLFQVY